MKEPVDQTGIIFDIWRFSIHDGPGVRTTVFLKGCPLRCLWCHNPESQKLVPELMFVPDRCTGCAQCFEICPENAHSINEYGNHFIDRALCKNCGQCSTVCISGALSIAGRKVSVSEVLKEVIEDSSFYIKTRGGLTVSGGEPMFQSGFTRALLSESRKLGLHTCLDTCGYAEWDEYLKLLDDVDIFLFDIKETDSARHRVLTGRENEKILENLRRIDDAGKKTVLRVPFIPGLNSRKAFIESTVDIALSLNCLEGLELLEYHPLGISKLEQLGRKNPIKTKTECMVVGADSATFKEALEIISYRLPGEKIINLK